MFKLFKKRKLNRQSFPYVYDVVEPSCIIWENTGRSSRYKLLIWLANCLMAAFLLSITLGLMIYIATYEKERKKYIKSECEAMSLLTPDQAIRDFQIQNQEVQLGLMNCYCKQEEQRVGALAQQIVFSDGQKHCELLK